MTGLSQALFLLHVRFRELRADDFVGGFVLRRYEDFADTVNRLLEAPTE